MKGNSVKAILRDSAPRHKRGDPDLPPSSTRFPADSTAPMEFRGGVLMTVYPKVNGTSPVKRSRRTKAEIAALDEALVKIVADFRPATVRQVFYQAVNRALVPKSETTGYRVVQRRLVAL